LKGFSKRTKDKSVDEKQPAIKERRNSMAIFSSLQRREA